MFLICYDYPHEIAETKYEMRNGYERDSQF